MVFLSCLILVIQWPDVNVYSYIPTHCSRVGVLWAMVLERVRLRDLVAATNSS